MEACQASSGHKLLIRVLALNAVMVIVLDVFSNRAVRVPFVQHNHPV